MRGARNVSRCACNLRLMETSLYNPRSSNKTKWRNKKCFTLRLQSTPNGNQSLQSQFGIQLTQRYIACSVSSRTGACFSIQVLSANYSSAPTTMARAGNY